MGGKSTSTSATKLNQISVQSSSLGLPITAGWGRARTNCNLIWYGAFTAIPHTTTQKAGKGLGGSSSNTTYTYTASLIMGVADGPIAGIRSVYRDKSTFGGTDDATAIGQASLSLATGDPDQPVWGYLTSLFPDQALNYSGIAYVYAQDYALNDSATLPNHSFEVDFSIQLDGAAGGDADPKDIVTDFLANPTKGLPGWSSGLIGDLADWSLYCRANNLLLSPVLDSQRTASDFLAEIMTATNSEAVWSEGVLKVATYGDASATDNGVNWSPSLTPVYDLTEDDFIPDADGKPVKLSIVDQSDAYNMVQVEYLDRSSQYNVAIAPAQDLDNIVAFGRRKQDPTTLHCICDSEIAQQSAQLLLQRTLYRREQYTFRLPWEFALLEPMVDYLTLSTSTDELQLDRQLVQIVSIEEDESDILTFTAEGVDEGAASAALYNAHSGSGYTPNLDMAPGSISMPVLINAPSIMTGGDPQVWVAAASTNANWGGCEVWVSADNVDYHKVGRIEGPAKIGISTAELPSHGDPDAVNTLVIDLSASPGALTSTTAANAAAGATLSVIGDEIVTFETATLTSAHHYALTGLRRGLYNSTPGTHAAGRHFAQLDDAVFRFGYGQLNLSGHIYIKLPSFNVFGRALEDISALPAYDLGLEYDALTTEWDLVVGPNRPDDYATRNTYGTANRVKYSRFESGVTGWAKRYDPANIESEALASIIAYGKPVLKIGAMPTASGQTISVGTADDYAFPVTPGERLALSVNPEVQGAGGQRQLAMFFRDVSGGNVAPDGGNVVAIATDTVAYGTPLAGFITIPTGAVCATIEVYLTSATADHMTLALTEPMVSAVGPNQVTQPTFSPGPNAADGADKTANHFDSVFTDQLGRSPAAVSADLTTIPASLAAEILRGGLFRSSTYAIIKMPDGTTLNQVVDALGVSVDGLSAFVEDLKEVGTDGKVKAVRLLNSNGYVSGNVQLNDGSTASEYIIADEWGLIDPADAATPGATPTKPFYYIGGVLYIDHAKVRQLDVDVVNASHVIGNALFRMESANAGQTFDGSGSAPSTAYQDVIPYTLHLDNPAEVNVAMTGGMSFTGSADFAAVLTLEGADTGIKAFAGSGFPAPSFSDNDTFTLAAGDHHFLYRFRGSAGAHLDRARLVFLINYNTGG